MDVKNGSFCLISNLTNDRRNHQLGQVQDCVPTRALVWYPFEIQVARTIHWNFAEKQSTRRQAYSRLASGKSFYQVCLQRLVKASVWIHVMSNFVWENTCHLLRMSRIRQSNPEYSGVVPSHHFASSRKFLCIQKQSTPAPKSRMGPRTRRHHADVECPPGMS